MAACDRECELCEYCRTCPISCTRRAIEARERKAGGKADYTTMTDGIKTFIRYGHIKSAAGLFAFTKHYKNSEDNDTPGEIWDTITDREAD